MDVTKKIMENNIISVFIFLPSSITYLLFLLELLELLELPELLLPELDLLREEPELLLGFEKLRLPLEDDLLELTLDPEELLLEDLSVLREERTFDERLDEEPEFLLAGATRRLEVDVFGLAIVFWSLPPVLFLPVTLRLVSEPELLLLTVVVLLSVRFSPDDILA
jgi:hypothetical protein